MIAIDTRLKEFWDMSKEQNNYGLFYGKVCQSRELHLYVDYSWENDVLTQKYISVILTYFDNHLIDWSYKKKTIISHRTWGS